MPDAAVEHERVLSRLSAVLAATDGIRDAVLIGSAVYAPDLARDYDVVLTVVGARERVRRKLAAALGETVDLIVRHPGDDLGGLALAVVAGRVLAGQGQTMAEAEDRFAQRGDWRMASFDEAVSHLAASRDYLELARHYHTGLLKETHFRTAFDSLFHAARVAALTFMGGDRTGWGGIQERLPPPWGQEFRAMASTLHVLYAYEGKLPKGEEETLAAFRRWEGAAERFVSAMRDLVASRERAREAEPER